MLLILHVICKRVVVRLEFHSCLMFIVLLLVVFVFFSFAGPSTAELISSVFC